MKQSVCFSSGPCAKRKNWSTEFISKALLGRSHRSRSGVEQIQYLLKLIREIHKIPDSYYVALTPGSNTGAVEIGLWNLLSNKVTCISFDVFAKIWYTEIRDQLKVSDLNLIEGINTIPNCEKIDFSRDVVFVYLATTSAIMFNNLDWIPQNRTGLTFSDAAAAAFAVDIDFKKLDVTSFGFQKGLGCEANQGVIVLSDRAMARFNSYTPNWAIPRILKMTEQMFEGHTINTPSMLCISEYINTLEYALENGGIKFMEGLCRKNKKIMDEWIKNQKFFKILCDNPNYQSISNTCLAFKDDETTWEKIKVIVELLEQSDIAYDTLGHTAYKPCLRIWHGPTVESSALEQALTKLNNIMERI